MRYSGLIDGGGKAGEVGLACGLLNRMNKKNVVPTPRTWKGRETLWRFHSSFQQMRDEGHLDSRLFD